MEGVSDKNGISYSGYRSSPELKDEKDNVKGEEIEVCPSIESLQYLKEADRNSSSESEDDESPKHEVYIKEEPIDSYFSEDTDLGLCPERQVKHQRVNNDYMDQCSRSASGESNFDVEDSCTEEGSSSVSKGIVPHEPKPIDLRKTNEGNEKPKRVREKRYACSLCPYRSAHHSNLRSHVMAKHSGEKPFQCVYCDYRTATSSTLKRHIMYKHTKEKSFQCPYCPYTAAQNSSIKSHVMHKHTNEKRFSCSLCEFSTVTSSNLKTHVMAKHSGERPLICSYCPYRAASSNGLNSHIMYNHTKEKPFACPHCEYSAVARTALKRHIMYTHTKEKPFHCTFCDYSAVTSSHIKRHINRKHSL